MKKDISAVGIIFEDLEGQILTLLRNSLKSKSEKGNTWGLVRGKIEKTEIPQSAIKRKTFEEIGYGLDIFKLEFLKVFYWSKNNLNITFHTFRYKIDNLDIKLNKKNILMNGLDHLIVMENQI